MSQPLRYLALGDSYTIGESVSEQESWPMILADTLRLRGIDVEKPTIIATTGWRTDNLNNGINIARLKEDYDLVSLLIGVNNQYQGRAATDYAPAFEDLLKRAIALAKGKKENVFVVSIPDYGFTPFGEAKRAQITAAIDEFNRVNREITERHGITYVNITDISREGLNDPSLVAADGLHPSGKQYQLWVKRIAPYLKVNK
ncbi:MAG: SGNH/GDSL hydrolase family protein [Cyclobacteriaceae bacterium]